MPWSVPMVEQCIGAAKFEERRANGARLLLSRRLGTPPEAPAGWLARDPGRSPVAL
jgi:hypothetical protein